MRSEKTKKILVYLMALALVLTIPAVYLRLHFCVEEAPAPVMEKITGTYGKILDREGNQIYGQGGCTYDEYYNLVDGMRTNGNVDSSFTLAYHYGADLAARSISVLAGTDHSDAEIDGASMTTTLLPGDDLVRLREAFGTYEGTVTAYNYKTGEVYVMLSLPSVSPDKAPGGRSMNENFGTFMPGSCFKIVAAACALSQDPAFADFTYTCTAAHSLPDGTEVTCGVAHQGPLTLSDAIGRSCNCYFAAMIGQFDVEQTHEILAPMGITVRKEGTKVPTATIDRIVRQTSSTVFSDPGRNADVWSMIGEVGNTTNLLELVCIAGAVANGGSSAAPYMVESIYDPNREVYTLQADRGVMQDLIDPEAAALTDALWSEATEGYYRSGRNKLDPRITHGKTGTSEIGDGNNRLILCVMEEYDTAFVVAVKGLPSGQTLMVDIANVLVDMIPAPAA